MTGLSEAGLWGAVTFLLVGGATVVLGRSTDILRDAEPKDFGGAKPAAGVYRRPYSLAQSQMAWWFAIVAASFVFLFVVKGTASGLLNSSSLVLLGIGTGTALGAAAIEQTKTKALTTLNAFQDTLTEIAALPPGPVSPELLKQRDELAAKLASENFLSDVLTDVDGVSLHRFQSLAWTFVLGVVFLIGVVSHLVMTPFDTLTLSLLGISGGTYLGFKIPEQPA